MTEHFFGMLSLQQYIAAFSFAMLGIVLSLLLNANARNVSSDNTPKLFSYRFLLVDNWKRIVLSILLIFLGIRFCEELSGRPLNMSWSLMLGISLDKIAQLLKKKSNLLKVNRGKRK